MTIINGTLEWPVIYTGEGCGSLMDTVADQDIFEEMAAAFLWNWTEKAYGTVEVNYRPCRSDCGGELSSTFWGNGPYPDYPNATAGWNPVLIQGQWFNVRCGICYQESCGCDRASIIELPGPVSAVTEILLDGVVLDEAEYFVDGATIWRLNGNSWPTCQEFSKPTTQVGTWQITYTRGHQVPTGGQVAAGTLACELARAAEGDPSCKLPQRIQSITRQGVTMAVLDPFEGIERGATGIWSVDSWVNSVVKPRRASAVFSPDAKPSRGTGKYRVGPR